MCATGIATLVHKVEAGSNVADWGVLPVVTIIDFMFPLRSEATHLPQKCGEIARHLLLRVCAFKSASIFMVCNMSDGKPSTKNSCRTNRVAGTKGIQVSKKIAIGLARLSEFSKTLQSDEIKNALFKLLTDEWMNSPDLIQEHTVSFAQESCYTLVLGFILAIYPRSIPKLTDTLIPFDEGDIHSVYLHAMT